MSPYKFFGPHLGLAPNHCRLYGLPTMEGRLPSFAFTVRAARHARSRSTSANAASYNTADEVDRLLAELETL